MSKLIKLTDETGALLANRATADGVTMAEEVRLLLTGGREQKILEQLDRIEKILSGRSSIASTTIAEMDEPVTPPALSEPEPEEYVELSYGEMIQRITAVKNELNAPDTSKERKEELENALRGLLVDLSIAE